MQCGGDLPPPEQIRKTDDVWPSLSYSGAESYRAFPLGLHVFAVPFVVRRFC